MYPQMIKKKIFNEKNAPKARFFMKKNAPQARLIKWNAPQAGFLTWSSWVLCPVNVVVLCPVNAVGKLFSKNHTSESASFNWLN